MLTIDDLSLPFSTELRLLQFRFDGTTVAICIEDDLGDECVYTIEVRASLLFSQIASIRNPNSDRFRFELIPIEDTLPVNEHGYYVAPSGHVELMKAAKLGLCLCIGQKAKNVPLALMLKGGLVFCTIPFSGREAIKVRVHDQADPPDTSVHKS